MSPAACPIPIFHVNGEDLPAVVRVARMATGVPLRVRHRRGDRPDRLPAPRPQRGGRPDDHAAARLPGHQEPSAVVAGVRGPRAGWTRATPRRASARSTTRRRKRPRSSRDRAPLAQLPEYWSRYHGGCHRARYEVDTGVAGRDACGRWRARLTAAPEAFNVHPKVRKLLEQRAEMAAGQAARGLRHGRGARVRHAGRRRRPGADDRARTPPAARSTSATRC